MQFNTIVFLLVLSGVCVALAQTTYEDCCFKYVNEMKQRTQRHAVKYRVQVVDGGCNIPAIIFTMKKGRELCTDPRERWVSDLMKKIDKKRPINDDHKKAKKLRWLFIG
ncbi:C-C motif chemokine 25 [Cyclopterus lumpus]|uniref:C-C motif chemokine n=1 Tax=Cyclopterus lumpus TaxID=8103 RepID=A0A8C3ANU5_CYCLU|nr:C-C motif chemokine 25 [Cyclopterus lumpus]